MKLKTTARLVFSVLTPIAFMATSAMADEPTYYGSHLSMGGYYQNGPSGYGQIEGFIPMWQAPDSILFADVRGFNQAQGQIDGNFGLGIRNIVGDDKDGGAFLWGLYGFYDVFHSTEKNIFHQLTFGGELKTDAWVADANVYLPVGTTMQNAPSLDASETRASQIAGYKNVWYRDGIEKAMTGFDAEMGLHIAYVPQLTAYLGGYYYQAPDMPNILGPRLRLNYDWVNPFGLGENWRNVFPQLSFQGQLQDDKQRGAQWYVGAVLRIGIGSQPEMFAGGLTKDMTDDVQRQYNVVTTEKMLPWQELTKADGTAENIWVVSSETAWTNAQADAMRKGADIIWLQTNLNDINNFTLANNQTLMAGTYNFSADGRSFSIASADQSAVSIKQAANQTGAAVTDPFITLGQNDTIEGLNISVANPLTNVAIGNINGASVGNLNLLDNTINGAVILNVNDGSKNSNITVIGNTFNSQYIGNDPTNPPSAINPTGALAITAGANTTITVSTISDNTFNVSGNYTSGILNEVNGNGGQINYLGSISDNQMNIIGISGDAAGIENYITSGSQNAKITIPAGITDNKAINVNALGNNSAYGIYNLLDGDDSVLSIGAIGSNDPITIEGGDNAYGIFDYVKGMDSNLTIASIENNTSISALLQNINSASSGATASAIANQIDGQDSTIGITGGIENNSQLLAVANGLGNNSVYGVFNETNGLGSQISLSNINDNGLISAVNNSTTGTQIAGDIVNDANGTPSITQSSTIIIKGGVNNNFLEAEAVDGTAYGISNTANGISSTVSMGDIAGNTISSNGGLFAYGIDNSAANANSTVAVGAITGNTAIDATSTGTGTAIGIYNAVAISGNDSKITISNITNNSITATGGTTTYGIENYVLSPTAVPTQALNQIEIGAINNNPDITANGTTGNAAGIFNNVAGNTSAITITSISGNNSISASGEGGDIYGIYNAANTVLSAGMSSPTSASTITITEGITDNGTIAANDTATASNSGSFYGIDNSAGSYGNIIMSTISGNNIAAQSTNQAIAAAIAYGINNAVDATTGAGNITITQGISGNTVLASAITATAINNIATGTPTTKGAVGSITIAAINANQITANGTTQNTIGINNDAESAGIVTITSGINSNTSISVTAAYLAAGQEAIGIENKANSGTLTIGTMNGNKNISVTNNGTANAGTKVIGIENRVDGTAGDLNIEAITLNTITATNNDTDTSSLTTGINNYIDGTSNTLTIASINGNTSVNASGAAGTVYGIANQIAGATPSSDKLSITDGITANKDIVVTNKASAAQGVAQNTAGIYNNANGTSSQVNVGGVVSNVITVNVANDLSDIITGMWNIVGGGTVNVGSVAGNSFDIAASSNATAVSGINNTGTGTINYGNQGTYVDLVAANTFKITGGPATQVPFEVPPPPATGLTINFGK
jgi:flagellin